MATKKDDHKTSNGNGARVKLRWLELDVEGGNSELVEGFKSFANALRGGATAPVRTLTASKPAGSSTRAAVVEVPQPEPPADTEEELVEVEPDEQASDETEESSPSSTGAKPKRPAPPRPNILNTIDVKAGAVSLKDFLEQRPPKKAQERILVVAAWLFRQHQIENFNRDYIYTCYQQMGGAGGWKFPNRFDETVRTIASRKGWFEKGEPENSFKVTIVGLNHADDLASHQ